MNLEGLLGSIIYYFIFALMRVFLLTLLFSISYFVIYKKIMKGEKSLWSRQFVVGIMIVGYILMVLSATFLSRSSSLSSGINLHLFSSYKDAWNIFSLQNGQLILNIFMFVPLGILLPLFHKRFLSHIWTIGVGFAFTLFIEGIQLTLKIGVFDLDDIFNNVLGTIIGYSLFMTMYTLIKKQRNKKIVVYLLPILVVVGTFSGAIIKYNYQQYGNMASAYTYKADLRNTKISSKIEFNKEEAVVPAYKTNKPTQSESDQFAKQFFNNIGINTADMVINHISNGISNDTSYQVCGPIQYSLYIGGNTSVFSYDDSSPFDRGLTPKNLSEEIVRDMLLDSGIEIPAGAVFLNDYIGEYSWSVDQLVKDNEMIDGTISCAVYSDDTIRRIDNNVIKWKKHKDVKIISEEAAYEQLLEGKFRIWESWNELKSIEIIDVHVDYEADTKNFLNPYMFLK